MTSLINLIVNTVNALISSMNYMNITSGLQFGNLILITFILVIVFDILRRMT